MSLQNKFSGDDPYLLTQQIQTSNKNQASLHPTLLDNDFLRGSSVTQSAQGLTKAPATPFPAVNVVTQTTIGAALGDVGQVDTVSNLLPDSGGNPYFPE